MISCRMNIKPSPYTERRAQNAGTPQQNNFMPLEKARKLGVVKVVKPKIKRPTTLGELFK